MAVATRDKIRPIDSKPVYEPGEYNKAKTEPDSALYSDTSQKGYTIEESYNKGLDRLSELYGTDFRKL
jgi:hypothetical protein